MEIYASQRYENNGYLYDHFQLKFVENKYIWFFIGSSNEDPIGYLLSEDREIIENGGWKYHINFEPADLNGEYFGNPSQ